MTSLPAVYGPPWVPVRSPREILLADPPRAMGCASHLALAVYAPALGELVRGFTESEVRQHAADLAKRGGEAILYRGAIQTGSGRWLWPIPVDRVALTKADPNPLTREGFALAVDLLHEALLSASTPAERRMVQRALRELSRDWPSMAPAELELAVGGIAEMIGEIPADDAFVTEAAGSLERAAMAVTGSSLLAGGPTVLPVLSPGAADLAARIGRDGLTFITDEYRHRGAMWSRDARLVVSRGVAQGLGRVDIGRNLQTVLRDRVSGRSEWYYRVVASATTSRARSFGQMSGYREAGIEMYQWEAMLDARTCEICRFLHGQVFPVAESLRRFERALRNPDPEAAVNEFPWYRVVGGETTPEGFRMGGDIFVSPRGEGPTTLVATVRESAVGTNDARGTFRVHTPAAAAGGTPVPPAHGLCRCTTVPV